MGFGTTSNHEDKIGSNTFGIRNSDPAKKMVVLYHVQPSQKNILTIIGWENAVSTALMP